ncbi:MAG: bifunctional phosphopantothenoylcysteine decarboxylase/phosphopantothenate--cysteine ligase CoaBC [Cyclobacteriaceae bacterium]
MLQGRKILLGVCGSIAAYKSPLLVRLLIKAGAEVKVIQTASSKDFVTPVTLATVSKNPVLSSFIKDDNGQWNNHVDLGLWADLMVIAPLSANSLAKLAHGYCDNLLTATYLSAKCPVILAPAMDLDMYQHPSTANNLSTVREYGNQVIQPEKGELASGLVGVGRMAEPESIVEIIERHFAAVNTLKGKRVLITSGPTYESIDPVRFIGNHSSGKMGLALAEEAAMRGASVTMVSGPSGLSSKHPSISEWKVRTADEMYQATESEFPDADIAIFAAAVSDYRPETVAPQKIKKDDEEVVLKLVKNKDIAMEMGKLKKEHQLTVGFALETEKEGANAQEKLKKKNLDLIVLNSLNDGGAGFSHDTNKITIFGIDDNGHEFELKHKTQVAKDIFDRITDVMPS